MEKFSYVGYMPFCLRGYYTRIRVSVADCFVYFIIIIKHKITQKINQEHTGPILNAMVSEDVPDLVYIIIVGIIVGIIAVLHTVKIKFDYTGLGNSQNNFTTPRISVCSGVVCISRCAL